MPTLKRKGISSFGAYQFLAIVLSNKWAHFLGRHGYDTYFIPKSPYKQIFDHIYYYFFSNPLSSELDVATAVASDVTSTIMAQRLELDNKSKTVDMLQKALNQQRELTVYHAKEMEKEGQRRLDLQKQEYEATVQRHQCFIDQVGDEWLK